MNTNKKEIVRSLAEDIRDAVVRHLDALLALQNGVGVAHASESVVTTEAPAKKAAKKPKKAPAVTAAAAVAAVPLAPAPKKRGPKPKPKAVVVVESAPESPFAAEAPVAAAPPAGPSMKVVQNKILKFITKNPLKRSEEIQAGTGVSPEVIQKALGELRRAGQVTTQGKARGTVYQSTAN